MHCWAGRRRSSSLLWRQGTCHVSHRLGSQRFRLYALTLHRSCFFKKRRKPMLTPGIFTPLCALALFSSLTPSHSNAMKFAAEDARPASEAQAQEVNDADLIVPCKRIGQLSIGMTVQEVYTVMKGADPTETMAGTNGSRLYKWGSDAKWVSVIIDVKTERV